MSNHYRSQIMPDFTENLRPQEKILWSGKPVRAAFFLPALGGVPFALFFWAVAIAFEYMGVPILTGPSFFAIPISGLTVLLIVVIPGFQLLRFRNSK